ncbi:MAG: SurA N-terminal domain-containing protein [Candidatus Omnitrophica bacterium]|nr:SurA N-terminal domain-containing protein [Candidatus Omnitrophota bacterium]
MLKIFRQKNVTKFVLWGLLILILPAFVLWGTGADRGRSKEKGPTFVGLIEGKKVTFDDFADSIVSIRCQVIMNYFNQPEVMNAFLKSKAFIGKLAWDKLLVAREAEKANIKVSNDEVVNFIRNQPIFLRGGVFDDKVYYYVLRNNMGLEPREFEEMLRSNLRIQKYNDLLTKDISVADEEIVAAYEKDNNKIKISYLAFPADNFIDKVKVEDAEIKDYYEAHKNELTAPAKEESMDKAAETTDAFDNVKADIKTFLTRKLSGELAVKSAGGEYDRIMRLMAKENLTFEASAAKLGLEIVESGFFSRNESIEGIGGAGQIADAAAKLKADEVSGVVETEKGTVIFKVVGSQKYDEEKFKEEKNDYLQKTIRPKKAQLLNDRLRKLNDASKVNIDFEDFEKYYR